MARTLLGAPRKVPTKNAQCAKIGNVLYTSGVPFNWDTGEIVGNRPNKQWKTLKRPWRLAAHRWTI
jgi:hypothetical protein